MLQGGAEWAVEQGYGLPEDLDYIEERGRMAGAQPELVSLEAKRRQQDEMGTLGSGNHYLEVQRVAEIYNPAVAKVFGIAVDDVVLSIHSGSRGLGHQVASDYSRRMVQAAERYGLHLPDLELACAPIRSEEGQAYLGAMRAAINCALANRQILTHLTRETFAYLLPKAELRLIYDVSHNTAKLEEHWVEGQPQRLYVHRKGATRALDPGHPALPPAYRAVGQPVLIGGTMGTTSYILVGTPESEARAQLVLPWGWAGPFAPSGPQALAGAGSSEGAGPTRHHRAQSLWLRKLPAPTRMFRRWWKLLTRPGFHTRWPGSSH